MCYVSQNNILVRLYKVSHRDSVNNFSTWTLKRSPEPPKLVRLNVPEHLWNSTYDRVVEHNTTISRILKENSDEEQRIKKLGLQISAIMAFIPTFFTYDSLDDTLTKMVLYVICFVVQAGCCVWPAFLRSRTRQQAWFISKKAEETRAKLNWAAFIDEQNELYQPFAIKVLPLYQNKVPKKLIIGAISLVQDKSSCAISNDVTNNKGNLLIKNLESLDRLFQSGSLTPEEFSHAKQQVLNESNTSSTTNTAVPLSAAPIVAYAESVSTIEEEEMNLLNNEDKTAGKEPDGTIQSGIELV